MMKSRLRQLWTAAWPMLCLCLVAGSRWLLESANPEVHSTALTESVGCWMAVVFRLAAVVLLRKQQLASAQELPGRWAGRVLAHGCGGAMAIAGAALAAVIASRHINANSATLALALTPCVVAVGVSTRQRAVEADLTARLWPGLAGIAGLLLLLPQPRIEDWRLGLALAAMPLLTGIGAVIFGMPRGGSPEEISHGRGGRQELALALAAVVYGALVFPGIRDGIASFTWRAAGEDGLLALLTVAVLGRLGATCWAAQFLLVPLVTLLEGAVLLRPVLDLRSWLAFLFLAISGGYLLVVGGPAAEKQAMPHSLWKV